MLYANPLYTHKTSVATLTSVGIEPPAEWLELAARFSDFAELPGDAALGLLTDAIVNGTKADTGTLWALAIAESQNNPQSTAAVRNHVQAAVVRRLHELYAQSAMTNFTKVCDMFDAAAKRLTAAAKVVDIDSDAERVVNADDKVRTAWSDALMAARELDKLVAVLAAAAELAGANVRTPEALFALTIDPGTVKRRTAWEAHDSEPGRCGKWNALLAAGCTIRAHRKLDTLQPYRRPQPMQEKWVQLSRGTHQRVMVDPEEQQHDEPAPDAKRTTKVQMLGL